MLVNRLTLLLRAAALSGFLAAGWSAPARAQAPDAWQSAASIRQAAEAAVRAVIDPSLAQVRLEAVPLDARLRLAPCAQKLAIFANAPRNAQSRVVARVSCPTPAWTLNVPVDVRRTHSILVLRRAVGRGEAIAAADVVSQTRELPGLSSPFVSRIEDLAGRLTRRPIPEGASLTADALNAALLIHRGQQVTLLARSAGFEVRAPGRAMADASANQRVRVQNLNTLKIIEGLADKDGIVRVSP